MPALLLEAGSIVNRAEELERGRPIAARAPVLRSSPRCGILRGAGARGRSEAGRAGKTGHAACQCRAANALKRAFEKTFTIATANTGTRIC